MITVLIVFGLLVWAAVAVAVGVVIGMGIRQADRMEKQASCCPHPVAEAPETVRGQFRAIVVVPPRKPALERLDVKA